jgi:hypothetical protein
MQGVLEICRADNDRINVVPSYSFFVIAAQGDIPSGFFP